jgi:hypothetical protein
MINNNTPGVKHKRSRVSDNIGVGLYTWQMPDGNILGDSAGNVLSVAGRVGDIRAQARLKEYVEKELGIFEGKPKFLDGAIKLTEGEHDLQMEQMLDGYVPEFDLGSLKDDIKKERNR